MSRRFTDTEMLLWNLEQEPMLASTMGAIALLDGPIDVDRLRDTVAAATSAVPVLSERVRLSPTPLVPHEWVNDPHVDLEHHVHAVRLPSPASRAGLDALAARVLSEPFDRRRPLWQMTVVEGMPRGRRAVVIKLHHAVADGAGALELAAHLLEFAPDTPPPPPRGSSPSEDDAGSDDVRPAAADVIRAGAERLSNLLGDLADAVQDPARAAASGGDALRTLRTLADQAPSGATPSPLWRRRSNNRRFTSYELPLDDLRAHAHRLDVRINDLFVVACAEAALRHHERAGVELEEVSTSAVISTRTADSQGGGNAFVPTAISLPGHGADTVARLDAVRAAVASRRSEIAETPDLLGSLGGFASLVPPALAAGIALGRARQVDIATSNLPGPDLPVWLAGRRIERLIPVGPVAGCAANATLLSFDGTATIGLHVDPVAVGPVEDLRADLRAGLAALGLRGLPR